MTLQGSVLVVKEELKATPIDLFMLTELYTSVKCFLGFLSSLLTFPETPRQA